jgi:predicted dehydrogenase
MEKVKLGVVGLGWVAQVIHLPILARLSDADVVCVCDVDKAKARVVAEKFGITRVYTDVQKMVESEDIAAVIVATSTDAHKNSTIASLNAGKDVLVEKPIARRYAEAEAMADAAKATKRKLMVGMNHRFRPDSMILKGFLENNELGKVYYTKTGWLRKPSSVAAWATQKEKSGGGAFIDLGIVMLDLAFWMMGYPDVKRVSASHFRYATKEVEDTSIVMITMKNGSVMNIDVSWSMIVDDDVQYCYVFGTDGSASLNPFRINKNLKGNVVNLAPAKLESPQSQFKRSYENELKHFLGAVRNIHPVVSTAEEALQRMKVAEAVYNSVRMGKEITLK